MLSIPANVKLKVFRKFSFKCQDCKKTDNELTIDHIIPLSKGGTNDEANLRVLCADCNLVKGNIHLSFLEKVFGFVFTRREAQKMRNEIHGEIMGLRGELNKDISERGVNFGGRLRDIDKRIDSAILKAREDLKKVEDTISPELKLTDIESIRNDIILLRTTTQQRDEKILKIVYAIASRLELLEH